MDHAVERKDHRALTFVIYAYAFSWAFWVPQALIAQGVIQSEALSRFLEGPFNVAAFGPTVAAFALIIRDRGLSGARTFVVETLGRRFSLWWLLPILLVMPAITWAALYLAPGVEAKLGVSPAALPGLAIYMLLLSGPLQEEFGWRGYLLPGLQARWSGLSSALIVGLVWAFWHMPLNFATGAEGPQYQIGISILIGSIITLTLTSVIITYLFNVTGGSVAATLLFHTSLNLSTFALFPVFEHQESLPFYTGLILVAAIVVVIVGGPRRLGRRN